MSRTGAAGPAAPAILRDLRTGFASSWLSALLLLAPVVVILERLGAGELVVFVVAALAIIPLAGIIGHATEDVALHTGPGIGGFLNATLGNAVELIIAFLALRAGLHEVVKASIAGSILGNVLLVLGLAMLAGGFNRVRQRFNRTAAGASAAMLALAASALVMPAIFQFSIFGRLDEPDPQIRSISLLVAIVLIAVYAASLWFSLRTHGDLFSAADDQGHGTPAMTLWGGVAVLVLATLITAVVAEILVGSLESATHALGLTEFFVGAVVVAVVGNAAEHSTAVTVAMRDKMDLAVGIAVGSATQVALLVAPVLVLASFAIGQPMTLVFTALEIVAIFLSVVAVAIVSLDGESNWFEGVQLLGLYAIVAAVFFFVPESAVPFH